MEILIERKYKKDKYTIGNLYVDSEFFSNTLEDKDRYLKQSMSEEEIKKLKVYGETAIPTGRYKITRTYSPKFGKTMILINDVKGFSGIRMHGGRTAEHSLGCPLLGENKVKGQLLYGKYYSDLLDKKVEEALKNEEVWITIK